MHKMTKGMERSMKRNSHIFQTFGLLFYMLMMSQLWSLCQYGGLRRHMPLLLLGSLGTAVSLLICLIRKRKSSETEVNCSPSRGQRKNIKFSRPAAKCCWPLFMQQGTTCVFLSALVRPSYAGLFWCCNNGCSTQSFARVPVCW